MVADLSAFIKLVVATVSALRSLDLLPAQKSSVSTNVSELRLRWQHELQKEGLSKDKSAAIALRFSKELLHQSRSR